MENCQYNRLSTLQARTATELVQKRQSKVSPATHPCPPCLSLRGLRDRIDKNKFRGAISDIIVKAVCHLLAAAKRSKWCSHKAL